MKHGKPWHHVSLETTTRKASAEGIIKWLQGDPELNDYEDYEACPPEECVLNVAGSRGSKSPGIEDAVMKIVVDVLIAVNPDCRDFYALPRKRFSGD